MSVKEVEIDELYQYGQHNNISVSHNTRVRWKFRNYRVKQIDIWSQDDAKPILTEGSSNKGFHLMYSSLFKYG